MTDEATAERAAEAALRAAADSMHEQLEALSASIEYHERRARELRETRKRVQRVEAIVNAPPDGRRNNGGARTPHHSDEALRKIAEATTRRHAEEREAKKRRVRQLVQRMGPGVDISGVDLLDELNRDARPNDPRNNIGRGLVVELCRELRDEGTLRLDRTANGGKAIYRLVGGDER